MGISVNSVLSDYTYTYKDQVRAKFDKNDDAVWDKSELNQYAEAYKSATGKSLDVDKLMETYGNDKGVIDYDGQQKMQSADALGFSVLKSAASQSSSASSSSSTGSSTGSTVGSASKPITMTQDQRATIYSAVGNYTYEYGGELQPLLDQNNDGMWSKDELSEYASAFKKATGRELNVDAIIEKYGNEDGEIDPKNQAQIQKDDALGLSTLKATYDSAVQEAEKSYYAPNPVTKDTTNQGKAASSTSMSDLLQGMSSSGKMYFSRAIQSMESTQNMLNSFLGASGSSSSGLFSLANARTDAINSYKLQMAQGGDASTLYQNMSSMSMNYAV